jgi:hypothetical protein
MGIDIEDMMVMVHSVGRIVGASLLITNHKEIANTREQKNGTFER